MAKVNATNMRLIAEKAGVSHITVSRALRGQGNVSEATRQKVERVAKELGYKSNPLVQAFASHIRRGSGEAAPACNLAWLRSYDAKGGSIQTWQKSYYEGAVQRAETLGYSIDVSINVHDYTDAQVDRLLEARGVRGVVLPFMDYFDREPYQSEEVATVALGESPSETPIHSVAVDYFKNMTMALDRMLAYGYERIGFCEHTYVTVLNQGSHWGAYLFNQQRLMPEQRLQPLLGFIAGGTGMDASRDAFMRWLEKEKPDVVLTTFRQVSEWLEAAGIDIPGEVALVHMSLNDDVADWSGVSAAGSQVGAAAIDLLTAHILRNEYGIPTSAKMMKLSGEWVDGRTTIRPEGELEAHLPASQTHSGEWFESELFGR
jgi:DNA-binding LacI/PurR family transcriptional regulator